MKTNYWLDQNRFLSHLRTSFCALAIAGASLTLPSAEADPPLIPAIGSYSPCFQKISEQQVGQNTIITYSVTASTTGTFTGSLVEGTERDVIHPDGSITFNGSALFVHASECGTVEFTYTGTGNQNTHEESGHFVGNRGPAVSPVYIRWERLRASWTPPATDATLRETTFLIADRFCLPRRSAK
jgi:hypothetical protein